MAKRIQELLHDDVKEHITTSGAGFEDILGNDEDTIFIVCCCCGRCLQTISKKDLK